jgi:hypothetical protein
VNDNSLGEAAQATTPAAGDPVCLDREPVAWAWAQPIVNNPGGRIVLLCLAVMADDAWECTPSQDEVAEVALLPARSVRRYLQQLEDEGYIQRHRRVDDKGYRLSDRCRLNPSESLPANVDGRQVRPPANVDGRGESNRPIWPLANLATGCDQQEHPEPLAANVDDRPVDLWPDWPLGEGDETDIPRSQPAANLPTGQIGQASSSPTENYEKEISSSSEGKTPKTKRSDDAPPRADVEHLCARLLQWLIKKDYRQRPSAVSDGWRNEARKLLDRDRVPLQEALDVLDWSQRDPFWSQNINSLPKFREKYGDLEMRSRGRRAGAQVHQLRPTGTDGRDGRAFAAGSGARAHVQTAEEIDNAEVNL